MSDWDIPENTEGNGSEPETNDPNGEYVDMIQAILIVRHMSEYGILRSLGLIDGDFISSVKKYSDACRKIENASEEMLAESIKPVMEKELYPLNFNLKAARRPIGSVVEILEREKDYSDE